MNFEEYQKKAITTRHRSYESTVIGKDLKYFSMGLIGETGELVDKVKKILRDDNGQITKERRLMLKQELGDITWYLANVCEETNINMDDLHHKSELAGYTHHGQRHIFDVSCLIAQRVGQISVIIDEICRHSNNNITMPLLHKGLCELFYLLEEFCTACALEISMVAQHNIEKLFSRLERGTIIGSGDNR
jgi:NTP pyrophosphatase (non-canonical NTP hydrolase)